MKNSVFQGHNQRVRRGVPVPLRSGAGASYTVASIGFVHTKPAGVSRKGKSPVTPISNQGGITMQRKLRINLRVSEDEMKVLSRSAKRAGLSLSAYLRQVGCSQPIKKKPGKALKDCFQMVGELRQNFRRASAASVDRALADLQDRLLDAYHEEVEDGNNKNLGD